MNNLPNSNLTTSALLDDFAKKIKLDKLTRQRKQARDFIKVWPIELQEKAENSRIFFVTFTFNRTKFSTTNSHLERYTEAFFGRLNNLLVPNSRASYGHAEAILIPESSPNRNLSTKHNPCHLHGWLVIPNQSIGNFYKKAVRGTQTSPVEGMEGTPQKESLLLNERLLRPYKPDETAVLRVHEYKIFELYDSSEYVQTTKYCMKDLMNGKTQYDDIIFHSPKPKKLNAKHELAKQL